jgi:Ca2+-transporting ATPase
LYFFATNLGEILIVLFAFIHSILSGTLLPLPLTAPQILWLNLITDGFLDISLSMEKQEPGLLSRIWLKDKPKLVDKFILLNMLFFAIPMGIISLIMFMNFYEQDLIYARTMTLMTMAMFQWFNAWNCRSQTKSILSLGLFTNKWLIFATLFVLGLQFSILYIPILQTIFKTTALSFHDWVIIVSSTFPIVLLEELRKYFIRMRVVEQ